MQKHTKVYINFFGYDESSIVMCEMECGDKAVDVHHLESRGMGGSKSKDYIENLMGLCRDCRIKAESDKMFNMYCKIKHLELVCHQVYALIDLQKRLDSYGHRKN